MILDTDGSRQKSSGIIFFIIKLLLLISARFYVLNLYITANKTIVNMLRETLLEEGYYIKNIKKGVYLKYPVLYTER